MFFIIWGKKSTLYGRKQLNQNLLFVFFFSPKLWSNIFQFLESNEIDGWFKFSFPFVIKEFDTLRRNGNCDGGNLDFFCRENVSKKPFLYASYTTNIELQQSHFFKSSSMQSVQFILLSFLIFSYRAGKDNYILNLVFPYTNIVFNFVPSIDCLNSVRVYGIATVKYACDIILSCRRRKTIYNFTSIFQ